jgi:hypothetical protein
MIQQSRSAESEEVTTVEQEVPKRVVRTTTRVKTPQYPAEPPQSYQQKVTIFRTYQALFFVLGIIEILLMFRFFLKLIGANPLSGFAVFIYGISGPFASPFLGIVPAVVSGFYVLEWSTLMAMAVYAVVVWIIVEFFQVIKPANPDEVEQAVNNP